MSLDPVVRALEALRRNRVWPETKRQVGSVIDPERERLERARKSLGTLADVWEQVVPPEFRERCWPVGLARRVLTVGVEDSATGYELSMWLRGGGEHALRVAAKTAISKVKVEVMGA